MKRKKAYGWLGSAYWVPGLYLFFMQSVYLWFRKGPVSWLEMYRLAFKSAMVARGAAYAVMPPNALVRSRENSRDLKILFFRGVLYSTMLPLEASAVPGTYLVHRAPQEGSELGTFLRGADLACLCALSTLTLCSALRLLLLSPCARKLRKPRWRKLRKLFGADRRALAGASDDYFLDSPHSPIRRREALQQQRADRKASRGLASPGGPGRFLEDRLVGAEAPARRQKSKAGLEKRKKAREALVRDSLSAAQRLSPMELEQYLRKHRAVFLSAPLTREDLARFEELYGRRALPDLYSAQDSACGSCRQLLAPGEPVTVHPRCGHAFHPRCFRQAATAPPLPRRKPACPYFGCTEPSREHLLRDINLRYARPDLVMSFGPAG